VSPALLARTNNAGIVCISVSSTRDALNDNFGKVLFNRRNTVKREF